MAFNGIYSEDYQIEIKRYNHEHWVWSVTRSAILDYRGEPEATFRSRGSGRVVVAERSAKTYEEALVRARYAMEEDQEHQNKYLFTGVDLIREVDQLEEAPERYL